MLAGRSPAAAALRSTASAGRSMFLVEGPQTAGASTRAVVRSRTPLVEAHSSPEEVAAIAAHAEAAAGTAVEAGTGAAAGAAGTVALAGVVEPEAAAGTSAPMLMRLQRAGQHAQPAAGSWVVPVPVRGPALPAG